MPNVGPLELAIVLIIALVVLGPKRLPEVGRSLGNGIREFKDSLSTESRRDDFDDDEPAAIASESDDEQPATTAATPSGTATPPPPSES